ncbi:MAG: DUF433 domain-containing protein [Gammaproteobacteria bacterium]|jgi:uncharacterized protein (DUF433 family)|nr:DUF433 domain-containing protein [Gammaproteobacteria bacterium]
MPEQRITIDPTVCGGRPCIRGMRIRVSDVLEMLAAGASTDEILDDYPSYDDSGRQTDLAHGGGAGYRDRHER